MSVRRKKVRYGVKSKLHTSIPQSRLWVEFTNIPFNYTLTISYLNDLSEEGYFNDDRVKYSVLTLGYLHTNLDSQTFLILVKETR